jgi:hypothetical protein
MEKNVGPISATVIIVLIVVAAGVYFFVKQAQHYHELKLQEQQSQLPATS